MRRTVFCLLSISLFLLLLVSCSSTSTNVTVGDLPVRESASGNTSHRLMGMWQFMWDPETQDLEYCQLRVSDMHLNVLGWLEPAPLLFLTLESDIEYDHINNLITVDIGLSHPFAGLNEFAGFDVKGIVISRADLIDATPSRDLKMPGPNTLHLVNADGYSRMWNPDEFPYDPENDIFTYRDGMLGAPDDWANYDAQLNGYKYFCDGLGPGDPVSNMPFTNRGLFVPGTKNIRTYQLAMPQGLIFNYAVDASWEFPSGGAPWAIPDDYPISANSPEAYHIDYSLEGMMFSENAGSDLNLYITVYDHQPGSIQNVYVEAKDLYFDVAPNPPAVYTASFEGSTQFTDVYSVHLENFEEAEAGTYPALICVEDIKEDVILSPASVDPIYYTAYKLIDIEVTPAPGVFVTLEEDAQAKGQPSFNLSFIFDAYYADVPPVHIVDYTDADGPWQFSYAYNEIVTIRSLPLDHPEVASFVWLYPPEITHFYTAVATYGAFGFEPFGGEQHDFVTNTRKIYGITELFQIGDTFIFQDTTGATIPMVFEYPYYYGTDFTTNGRQYMFIGPIPVEAFECIWRVRGIGEGQLTLTPGGMTYPALLMRHDITLEILNSPYIDFIVYEWLHDDGTPLAYICSANTSDGPPFGWGDNFNSATGNIYGQSLYHILQGY